MRFLTLGALVFGGLALTGAGCSSDPNVEGAKLNLRNRDYAAALTNVEAALAKNPNNAEALDLKGQILSAQATAATDPAEAGRLAAAAATAYRAAATADPEREPAATAAVGQLYGQLFTRGVQAFNAGQTDASRYSVAADYFGAAALVAPDSADAYINRAYAYINAERPDEAVPVLQSAIDLNVRVPEVYLNLAQIHSQAGRTAEVIAVLERAEQALPGNNDITRQLLTAYVAGGQAGRAMERYNAQVAAEPRNALYRFNYGTLLLQANAYDQAIEQLRYATDLDPTNSNAFYNLGAAHINKAVKVNDEIQAAEDALRTERANLTAAQRTEREAAITALVESRTQLFRDAVAPLRQGLELVRVTQGDTTELCRALFQSLAQSNQMQEAQEYRSCAGM